MYTRRVSDCPVGATWTATEDETKYKVWLDKRDGVYEIWWIDVYDEYSDGSIHQLEFNWYPSRSSAFKAARGWMNRRTTRFKRSKELTLRYQGDS